MKKKLIANLTQILVNNTNIILLVARKAYFNEKSLYPILIMTCDKNTNKNHVKKKYIIININMIDEGSVKTMASGISILC